MSQRPRPCTPREGATWLGRVIPGRRGGTVAACATDAPTGARRASVWLGLPVEGFGNAIKKTTARDRLRAATRGTEGPADPLALEEALDRLGKRCALPEPTGLPYPHRRGGSPCAPSHPLWEHFPEDLDEAMREGLEAAGDAADEDDVRCLTRAALDARHPEYSAAAATCRVQQLGRARAAAPKAVYSTARERGQNRVAAMNRGVDVTSAEYLDDVLEGATVAKRRR